MDMPILALEHFGIPYRHVFASEVDNTARRFILGNFTPERMYGDIRERDNSRVPHVDLYVVGFPCQPFSTAGKRQGTDDPAGRGDVVWSVLDYIEKREPTVFVLENAPGLRSVKGGRRSWTSSHDLRALGDTS